MHYLLSGLFGVTGSAILIWNKQLAEKMGGFYSYRYSATFGKLATFLRLDNPNTPFSRFMYRGFVITAGIVLLMFAIAAASGTNFVGPSGPGTMTSPHGQ